VGQIGADRIEYSYRIVAASDTGIVSGLAGLFRELIGGDLVVSAAQVLHERVTGGDHT